MEDGYTCELPTGEELSYREREDRERKRLIDRMEAKFTQGLKNLADMDFHGRLHFIGQIERLRSEQSLWALTESQRELISSITTAYLGK